MLEAPGENPGGFFVCRTGNILRLVNSIVPKEVENMSVLTTVGVVLITIGLSRFLEVCLTSRKNNDIKGEWSAEDVIPFLDMKEV